MEAAVEVLLVLGCALTILGVLLQVRGAYRLEPDPDDVGTFIDGGSDKLTTWSVGLIGSGSLAGLVAGLLSVNYL